jgi:glyoxylase-like metal-dependent hydrolase (beta-lactamase superfamily II)
MRRTLGLALALVVAAGCRRTTPEMRVIDATVDAMGGRERILEVRTVAIEGEGENFNLGQNRAPDADLPMFKVTAYRRVIDYGGLRWRQEQMRTPQFLTGNPSPVKQVAGLDGGIAYNVAADGTATRATDAIARDRRLEIVHTPIGVMQAALAEGATLSNAHQHDGHDIVDIKTAAGDSLTLAVDASTHLPVRVVSMTDQPNLGDVAIETEFGSYQDTGGLMLPTRITSKLDRQTLVSIAVARTVINGETGDLAAPAAARNAAAPVATASVAVEPIADGVWYLAGQSHHSVLVELSDQLVLVEAPQHDTRALAVIAKARELRPGKPLRKVIVTHHHFDHSGGVRAAVSEGLTIVAHAATRPFFEDLVRRSHTMAGDALAKNPKPLAFEGVAGELVMQDPMRTLAIYPIEGNPHADTLLMVYLPKERVLVEADVYTPPALNATTAPRFPFAANLVENITKRKLRVDRLAPIHGRIVPFSALMGAVAAMGASQ